MGNARQLTGEHREAFARIVDDTRQGFAEVIDLILIHNERTVSGPQPRTTLNPLIAMLSVAAWERFVADVGALARSADPASVRPGEVKSNGFNVISDNEEGGHSKAVSTLKAASGGILPDRWRILVTTVSPGVFLKFGYTAEGLDPQMTELVDWWILVRHKVAHRAFPQLLKWTEQSDAEDGKTINATLARSAFTLFLQLADQSIRALTEAAEFESPDQLWLPEDWLTGTLLPQRGVDDPAHLHLWKGRSLAR
ncbi:hypothetical protein [Nocardia acidivorans]|uniref:hypothetical protein n=1 Tax=Nocardia acidivorans TaxID=404580 RepID=UPI0008300CB6|nr:hypothetical protein [Nocardia acidivorans]